jgi:type I restriction enzyme S subunit
MGAARMIADLKPYAAYRTAEGEWLGEIPSHWTVRRMKYVVQENDLRSTTGNEQLLRVSQFTGVTQRLRADGQEEQDTRAASLVGYKRVEPDELVINIMLAWNGSMGVSRYPGIASPAYCVYRFKPDAQPWYFHHLLRSPSYKARIKAMSTGVVESRLRLYSDDLFRIEALLPPPEEQAAIVRFLDWANARLESTIRAKRRVIALLTEQKQAIIHRAVTRGLDPTAPLKPSGIAWLGDIPAHWEVMQLRQVLSFGPKNGVSPQAAVDTGILSFSISAIRDGRVTIAGNEKTVALDQERVAGFRIYQGDILLVRGNGNVALVGKCGLVHECPEICIFPDILMKLRPNERMTPEYIVLAINSAYVSNQVSTLAKTSNGAFKVSGATVRSIAMVVPPLEEQKQLVGAIATNTDAIDTAISRLNREIDLLREYRTRLVADVVTGKLDVRAAAAALPQDELPSAIEPDALDADDDLDALDESESDNEETAA